MTAIHRSVGFALALLLLGQPASAEQASPRDQAERLFLEYQHQSQAFDPDVADLYVDWARIVNARKYPGDLPGRSLQLTGFQYKDKLRQLMPIAKARGDFSTYSDVSYSDVSYSEEGERIRIQCTRFSALKKYSSPYSLLVGPDERGDWRIFEELSESRP
jgi:hypothetical protein